MKKFFLLVFVVMTCSTIFAQSDLSSGDRVVTTFYGSKASSNPDNPCKGSTVRVCAKVERYLLAVLDDQTMVTQRVLNSEGEVISTTTVYFNKPVKDVKNELINQAVKTGGIVEEYPEY